MKKVSLRESVADKIVFAVLLTVYYWMWARNDWKDYYATIQNIVYVFSFYYFVSRSVCQGFFRIFFKKIFKKYSYE